MISLSDLMNKPAYPIESNDFRAECKKDTGRKMERLVLPNFLNNKGPFKPSKKERGERRKISLGFTQSTPITFT